MKNYKSLLFIFSIFISLAFTFIKINTNKRLSVEKAIKQKIISAEIKGAGGHSGNCIKLKMKNLTSKDTIIRIESGRRLVSDDSMVQDILLIKELLVPIFANSTKTVKLYGFCCQASNGGPGVGAKFSVGSMADTALVIPAKFFNQKEYPEGVMQSAVWCISNNHSINSVHNGNKKDKEKMKELYQLLAGLKKQIFKYPWYTLSFKMDTAVVFTGRPEMMYAEIDYTLRHNCNVDLNIRDTQGHLYHKVFSNKPHNRGEYTQTFEVNVSKFPKGKYLLQLYADNQLKLKKTFEL